MSIRISAQDAGWQLREAAEDARWGVREAAWSFQERVLWRVSDRTRLGLRKAQRLLQPLQRLIETKLAWPLVDRLDDYGVVTRTAVATFGVTAALGAGVAGAMVAGAGAPGSSPVGAPIAAAAQPNGAPVPTLEGVPPDFASDPNGTAAAAAKSGGGQVAAPAQVGPATPPQDVALSFAQSFVQYEVGRGDERTTAGFAAAATKPLATSLGTDPPRLPAGTKVPQARVLNVVLGKQTGDRLTASVSLVRLEAASELRLTMIHTPKRGWRVAEVLG
jgi:hypothetical protein